jgi:hypothetical protein
MDGKNQEIETFPTAEGRAQDGMVDSDLAGTWDQYTLTEFAELCREDADLLNFDTLQLERDGSDDKYPPCPAGKTIQCLVERH